MLGGGVNFDSHLQLASRIQDALGADREKGQRAEAEVKAGEAGKTLQ